MPNDIYYCGCDSGLYKCGGIAPVKATDDMTQPVGQRNGKLFTKPGGTDLPDPSGVSDGYVLTVQNGAFVLAAPATELPTVSAADNGKVLIVVNGAWAADTIPDAEGVNF